METLEILSSRLNASPETQFELRRRDLNIFPFISLTVIEMRLTDWNQGVKSSTMKAVKGRTYTIYSILTSLLWEAILALVVLRLLPNYGVSIPLWALIVLMAVLGAYEYMGYWLGKRALHKTPLISLEALISRKGKTTTQLKPRGYVRLGSELWRAKAESEVGVGEEVTVVGVEGMTLLVSPSCSDEDETI